MRLPSPRGPLSAVVMDILAHEDAPGPHPRLRQVTPPDPPDIVGEADIQLTLWTIYELSYHGLEGVDPGWEWDPDLLALRASLERPFEDQLRSLTRGLVSTAVAEADDVGQSLFAFVDADQGPPMARYLQREASRDEMLEFLVQRSIYHLKESDPHSFVLPRLEGAAKVVLAELQYDEYGAGRPSRLHSDLYAQTLRMCGLDSEYGAYVDVVSAPTLALNNAMTMFALHRRLMACDMGHLGAFEATSSQPCRRIAGGLRRLGFPDAAVEYFDEHVEADAVHEQLALRGICAALVEQDARYLEDVFFGAAVCLALEARASAAMLDSWKAGVSSLSRSDLVREGVGA